MLVGVVQPSKMMSPSGRWVASPTAQGASQAHSFFGRPSKAAANSPQGVSNQPQGMFNQPQGVFNQPYGHSPGQGPISASWSGPSLAPSGTAQHGSNTGSMPSVPSAATPGRWQGFTQKLRPRPRPQRHGSGALLVPKPDPAVLSSIAEGDQHTGDGDTSLPAYQSSDLDASTAAPSASKRWAISAPSLSPRRSPAASQGSSQGSYAAPSPWSTPVKQPQSDAGRYPVPAPQSTPPGTLPRTQSWGRSPSATVGPFEAAALARAAQRKAQGRSPDDSASSSRTASRSPSQAVYPVPSPAMSNVQAGSDDVSSSGSATLASSQLQRPDSQGWASSGSWSRRRRQ